MGLEKTRLASLIEYAEQLTRLRTKPSPSVASHGMYSLHEHQLAQLPGVSLNLDETEGEVWLSVARLHATAPPSLDNPMLSPWVELSRTPDEAPIIRESTSIADAVSSTSDEEVRKSGQRQGAGILFSEYDKADHVRALFDEYVLDRWEPWARSEKLLRSSISLYAKLFTLKQQLEDGMSDAQIELVWGIGLGVWQCDGVSVSYPLITRLAELSLNSETAAIEVRPRDIDARLDIDWYTARDNPGAVELDQSAKRFFSNLDKTVSPFDPSTFEPLLRTAASTLDARGIYWPDQCAPGDRSVPRSDGQLKVTNTWVLFARPRSQNIFLQDLERLKSEADISDTFPPAVTALVTDPDTHSNDPILPVFRGVSSTGQNVDGSPARDLYFPKPYNEEQVRIIQLLEASDAVVVQGPPGTGKTHTIANVICHYLASGKRVLVTSMKEPALGVLRDQLPDEIRPLAISLLSSEQDGMKQFEHAISKVASEVQTLDRSATRRFIAEAEGAIDNIHARIAALDRKIKEWAAESLSKITIDGEEIDPLSAALEVAQFQDDIMIADRIGIDVSSAPPLSDADIVALREARRILGGDIRYLGVSLPNILQLPKLETLLDVHRDMVTLDSLQKDIESGTTPQLADGGQDILTKAQQLASAISYVRKLREEFHLSGRSWDSGLRKHLRVAKNDEYLEMLANLGRDIQASMDRRKSFVAKPVALPEGFEEEPGMQEAVENLSNGRNPFGLLGLVGKRRQKKLLGHVRVVGTLPVDTDGWRHVADYLKLQREMREQALRWNTLAEELPIKRLAATTSEDCVLAADEFAAYLKTKELVKAENIVSVGAKYIFPTWEEARHVNDHEQHLLALELAIKNHITKNRLRNIWQQRDELLRVLDGTGGDIVDEIRCFMSNVLGSPATTDVGLQAKWSELIAELSRLQDLAPHLREVGCLSNAVEEAGAPIYAAKLREPMLSTFDDLLPNNWRQLWRARRLTTHLESIDRQEDIKKFAQERTTLSADLTKRYNDLVSKRTWLKLAERASPSVRAALQAYLTAIQKIGAGTGKRAIRYRRDARQAANHASSAIPCWIMAHYRVSESLPAELGHFDLVVIDEASQSDFQAFPSILRAKKALIVGDDKQVSPEGVGIEEAKVVSLLERFLRSQVSIYRNQMTPERSMYDLFNVVFAHSTVMLKEHFRCVRPIIEFSKREFYNHELKPLRLPKASERIDPPLVDVLVKDGYRSGDINLQEARFIVNEIKKIVSDPKMHARSIGVVTLLGDKQASKIWDLITQELETGAIENHRIASGDARTFQGKERDIMFVSMVAAPNELGLAMTRDTFAQRFNVAASRARDRMYLVRSVEAEDLSPADKYRRSLIGHFAAPFAVDEDRVEDLRSLCESDFERDLYDELTNRGFYVVPQVKVGQFRIDMVVEGANDIRLAVECDGDKYHGPDRWIDDMDRQRVLERAGWTFWRCFASAFVRRRSELLDDLLQTLAVMSIMPVGPEGRMPTIHVERRMIDMSAYDADDDIPDDEQQAEKAASEHGHDSSELAINLTDVAAIESKLQGDHGDHPMIVCLQYKAHQVGRFEGDLNAFLDFASNKQIQNLIEEVIEAEGPICQHLLAKRVASHWGISKIGSRVDDRVIGIARRANSQRTKTDGTVFFWPRNIIPSEYRTYRISDDAAFRRSADEIPPEEIANAVHHTLILEGAMSETDLIVRTARRLGYGRTGETVAAQIRLGIRILAERGDTSVDGSMIVLQDE